MTGNNGLKGSWMKLSLPTMQLRGHDLQGSIITTVICLPNQKVAAGEKT